MPNHSTKSPRRIFANLICAAVVVLAACAGTRPGNGELPTPPARLVQSGYSFLPPNESGWFIADRTPQRIMLVKSGKLEGDTYLIESTNVDLERVGSASELTRYVKTRQEKDLAPPRFRIQSHQVSEQKIGGADCALAQVLSEDRQPGTGSNIVSAMLVETISILCIHPMEKSKGVALTYSHRSFPEDRDPSIPTRGSAVLGTLQFTAPGAQPQQ